MSDHTPEPWAFGSAEPCEIRLKRRYWQIGQNFGKGIGFAFGDTDANARRIVTCVNSCAGIDNETLDKMVERGGVAKFTLHASNELKAALFELRAARRAIRQLKKNLPRVVAGISSESRRMSNEADSRISKFLARVEDLL